MSHIKLNFFIIFSLMGFLIQGNVFGQTINGSGNIITTTVNVSPITSLSIFSEMSNILIQEGSTQTITLHGDDNILDSLNIYASGDSLIVEFPSGNTYDNYDVDMTVTLPNIKSVDLFDLGELTVNSFSNATELAINNHGEGNIQIEEFLTATTLDIINNNSGEITMNSNFPALTNYTVYVHGSGNFYGCELDVDSCFVQNFGTGHAYVKANSFLNATIFGSGNIEYFGTPTLYQNNFGTGNIVASTSSSCPGSGSGSGSGPGATSCVDGDLNIISQSVNLTTIKYLNLSVDVTTVEISQGSSQSITITGDSNVVNLIDFTVVGDTLQVLSDSCFQNHSLSIEIVTPNFEHLNFHNSGEVIVNDFVTTETLKLYNYSTGNITIGQYNNAYYLSVNNYDSGNITMTADFTFVSSYQVNNYGSGNYYGCALNVASCYALNTGSGLISVGVSGYLNGTIEGSGNIEYYDTPANIDENITGTGQVLAGTDPSCIGSPTGVACIEGNGNIITQTFNLSTIEHLVIEADFTTFALSQGGVQNFTVEGDNNILDSLDFTVVGDTVFIQFLADTCFENYVLALDITIPNLSSIAFLRTGQAEINDFSNVDSLTIINSGNANVTIGDFPDVNYLDINNEGSGDITLTEEFTSLNTLSVTNTGTGDYNGCEQSLETCYAVNSGSGTISVQVTGLLHGTITGTGNIEYYGQPNIQSNITGSGLIVEGTDADCLSLVVSVDEFSNHSFVFYPNPGVDVLHITNLETHAEIRLITLLGEELMRMKAFSTQVALDISKLDAGTYVLKVNGESQLFVKQ